MEERHSVESQHRQRLLKSTTNLERTIYKLSCSLFSHNCVLLTFFFEHLFSVSGIFFDCSTYYFANHNQNYKFCCISILACPTRKTSQCESALLFIQNGPFQAFRQWRLGQKAKRRGKNSTPLTFLCTAPDNYSNDWNRLRLNWYFNLSSEIPK